MLSNGGVSKFVPHRLSSSSCSLIIIAILFLSLTRLRCLPFLLFFVRLGANGIVGMSVAVVGKFVAGAGVGTFVVG